jgi:hypothetical protein
MTVSLNKNSIHLKHFFFLSQLCRLTFHDAKLSTKKQRVRERRQGERLCKRERGLYRKRGVKVNIPPKLQDVVPGHTVILSRNRKK